MLGHFQLCILENSQEAAERVLNEFTRHGMTCTSRCVQTEQEFRDALQNFPCDAILANAHLSPWNGMAALRIARAAGEDPPFIFFETNTTPNDTKAAITAMREGAQDYILKEDFSRMVSIVEREIKEARIRSEERRADDTLRDMTSYDPVTSLPSRILFLDRLQGTLAEARTQKRSVAVLMLNLFQFKEVSDAFGYNFGNIVLQQAGERLKRFLPESYYISRLYENDFAVMAPFTEPKGEIQIAEQIVRILETSFMVQNIPIALSVRIGIAVFPDHEMSAECLVQDATVAMHRAKAAGNDYQIYSPSFNKKSAYYITLMGELRNGIQSHQLVLYYQPKIALATGKIYGVEALVRWQHPQYGFLLPGEFIPTAENSGLLKPVTTWNIETCAEQLKTWGSAAIPISVNLSGQDLLNYALVHQVERALTRTNVPPHLLEVEITETALITSPIRAKEILCALSGLGISISIDDFGSGYTSLGMLKNLPVNAIKLDQSLIQDLIRDKNIRFTVVAVIDLVHHLGLTVTAEGVEDEATHDLLVIAGCDLGQGYYYGHPMPAEEMMARLKERSKTIFHRIFSKKT